MSPSHPYTDAKGMLSRRPVKPLFEAVVVLLLGLLLFGCGKSNSTRLHNTFKSPDDLIQRVLQALEENDTAGLRALCLSRYEHDSVLVPAMGKENVDLDLAWFYLAANIDRGVSYAISTYGGRQLTLVSVEFRKSREKYRALNLHRNPQVTVRDQATGETFDLPIFGTVAEENGHFKLVSIRD